ncbi:MAG: sugar ABC transporter ATP-binding protein [Anaerolineales bacterium]|nr:sugar ABC transporter ATP-binding protein [Anaerolineales bacterium]
MPTPDILLELRGIHKAFPGVKALEDIDLDILRGETHMLLGENGAGKSTLIKILTGVYLPDAGTISFGGRPVVFQNPSDSQKAGISVIYQESHLVRHLTVAENIFLGSEPHIPSGLPIIDQDRMIESANALLDRLNLPIDPLARIDELSAAERRMIEVARALHLSAEMIIMDEPTAALSAREAADLFGILRTLRAQGVTILYISHRLEEVLQLGDRATVLRDGRKITTVPLAEASLEDLILWIVGRYLPGKFSKALHAAGPEVLRVEGLRRSGSLEDVSFALSAGEVLGVTGLIGAGGTALSRALFGADPAEGGSIFIDGQPVNIATPDDGITHGIGLLPEDRLEQGLILQMQARHNMTLVALENAWPGPWIDHSREIDIANFYAGELGIRSETLTQPARTLSGGTQQKLVLSKWLAARARVLIFDEPTRGVDVGARVEIYRLMNDLARRGTAIILVSSDLNEILGMCDRILVMRRGTIAAELLRANASQREILRLSSGVGTE